MSSTNYRRPANVPQPVDWQKEAIRLHAKVVELEYQLEDARQTAQSYKDAATELYLWTKGQG